LAQLSTVYNSSTLNHQSPSKVNGQPDEYAGMSDEEELRRLGAALGNVPVGDVLLEQDISDEEFNFLRGEAP